MLLADPRAFGELEPHDAVAGGGRHPWRFLEVNDIIPRARGEAAKIEQEAEAYKRQKIAESEGEAQRFLAVYNEYVQSPEVTSRRLYLETMEDILADMDKIILDTGAPRSE